MTKLAIFLIKKISEQFQCADGGNYSGYHLYDVRLIVDN